jgi:hypothetical protein
MNAWTVSTFWDTLDALADLPKLDSTRPLPLNPDEGTLPPLMKVAYEAYEPLFREHFTFNPLMDSLIKARRGDLDDFRLRFDDAPLVGCAPLPSPLRRCLPPVQRALPRRRQDWLRVHQFAHAELVRGQLPLRTRAHPSPPAATSRCTPKPPGTPCSPTCKIVRASSRPWRS